ncbi:hypothetical protein [Sporomusa termitida]|nr:hypothetical protein [Sporomusa termitida]
MKMEQEKRQATGIVGQAISGIGAKQIEQILFEVKYNYTRAGCQTAGD